MSFPQAGGRIVANLRVEKDFPVAIYNDNMGLISRGTKTHAIMDLSTAEAADLGLTGLGGNQRHAPGTPLTTATFEHKEALQQIANEANIDSRAYKEIQTTRFMMNPLLWSVSRSKALSKLSQAVYSATDDKMAALATAHVPAAKAKIIAKKFFDFEYESSMQILNTQFPISSDGVWLLWNDATNVVSHDK